MAENKMELLTVKELQKTLKIGRDVAYSLMHSRSFPSIKLGGRYFVEESALKEWIQKQRYHEFKI